MNPFDLIPDEWFLVSLTFTTNIPPWMTLLQSKSDNRKTAWGYGATPTKSVIEAAKSAKEASGQAPRG